MIGEITTVWTEVMNWITGALGDVQVVFYSTETSKLTFLGTLAVVGVSIAIGFLIIGVVQKFLSLRAG